MRSFFIPFILGISVALQKADYAELITNHPGLFFWFAALFVIAVGLDIILMVGKVRKIWRKNVKIKYE